MPQMLALMNLLEKEGPVFSDRLLVTIRGALCALRPRKAWPPAWPLHGSGCCAALVGPAPPCSGSGWVGLWRRCRQVWSDTISLYLFTP